MPNQIGEHVTSARRTRPFTLSALVAVAALMSVCFLSTTSASAASESYGEVLRFGHAGSGSGALKLNEYSAAFGVDTTEGNSVYVGDEPKRGEYRVQKLASANGAFLGAATFTAECAAGKGAKCYEGLGEQGIEGIAFDTVGGERRVYVLADYERAEKAAVSPAKAAAGAIYAFSTKPSGEALAPAVGTGAEGVLATPTALEATSETQGAALLEPKGIAVDPVTHDIIVAGTVNKGAGTGNGVHLAVLEISDQGKVVGRYVDPVQETTGYAETNSPVVTQTGQILMQRGSGEIVQIPTDFSSTSAPTLVFQLNQEQLLVEFGEESENHGAGLSLLAEGERAGRLYAGATISTGASGTEGVEALSYEVPSGSEEVRISELGWVAGASPSVSHECAVGFEGEFAPPMVAAGAGNRVFVLEPGFSSEKAEPQVVEFGAGGSTAGCPKAEASEPQLSSEGTKLAKAHLGKEVTLSSTLKAANALSVEWSFGDGSPTKTVTTYGPEETEVTHTFAKTGDLEVIETIHTDNLATPVVTVKRKVEVETSPPKACFSAMSVSSAEATPFNGECSSDPNGTYGTPLEYTWEFGDGAKSDPSTEPTIKHSYGKAGTYTATLRVTDALKLTAEVKHEVVVKTVTGEPKIEINPASVLRVEGEEATLTAKASEAASVQWEELSTAAGAHWAEVAGASSDTLSLKNVKASQSGYQYRAVFKNASASATTSPATLTVESKLAHEERLAREAREAKEHQEVKEQQEAKEHQEAKEAEARRVAAEAQARQASEALAKQHKEEEEAKKGVLPSQESSPDATIAGTSVQVSSSGSLSIKISCPPGETSCAGIVTLRTLNAVAASAKVKKAILTLVSGSFTVPGGGVKTVTLHLSAKGRALLAKEHVLRARATVLAHNVSGASHTGVATLTLRLAKPKSKKH